MFSGSVSATAQEKQNIIDGLIIVAVNQFIQHPNLDAVLEGVREALDNKAKENSWSINYQIQVANGDIATTNLIAKQQAEQKPDIILALATPSAQASVKATKTIPVIFGAITDPVAAELVDSLEHPGGNATGTSDRWPYEKQFELIRRLLPKAKSIGIPFNPGEANSVASMKMVRPALQAAGFQAKEVAVSNTAELIPAVRSIIRKSDVLFAPADNTVLSGLEAIAKLSRGNKVPLFVGDEGSMRKGGIATYGINYHDLGQKTGEIVARVLKGAPPASIPVAVGSGARLIVNRDEGKRQGLIFPKDILEQAVIIQD